MVVAERVLRQIKRFMRNSPKHIELDLGAYQNGREQGYSLRAIYSKTSLFVCWSECRNSDRIVVYIGDIDPMQSITDKMYKEAKYFRAGDYENVANFIIGQF